MPERPENPNQPPPEQRSSQELQEQERNYEIYRGKVFDIIVRNDVSNAEEIKQIALQFREGIPETWVSQPQPPIERPLVYHDKFSSPHFYLKKRRLARISPNGRVNLSADKETRTTERAFVSISNELILAQKVGRILADPEIQKFAKEMGFSELRLCDPLFGGVNKKTYERFIVYPYIQKDMTPPFDKSGTQIQKPIIRSGFTTALHKIFRQNGIKAFDLMAHQFIISKEDGRYILYLIDIEGFTPIVQ